MIQPQSDEEIRVFVERLRASVNDCLLDIRWNPKARLVKGGSYSALGKRVDGIYDGRWEVIRYDDAATGHTGFHPDRGYTVVCTVTEPRKDDGIWYMVPLREGGAYAPIGDWLLELLRQSDAANTEQFRRIRDKLWRQNDRAETARDQINEGAVIEALDHNHFQANYAGRVGNWQGKGADFTAMEATAAEARAKQKAVQRILSTTTSR